MMFGNGWPRKILQLKEANFYFNEQINIDLCRIWEEENIQDIEERFLRSARVIVWCDTVIKTCPVPGQWWHDMLRNFEIAQFQEFVCLEDIIFIQNGTSLHVYNHIKQLLINIYQIKNISLFGKILSEKYHISELPVFALWIQ